MPWIVLRETLRVRSAELEGLIGEIDDHRAFEIVFFLLLAEPRSRRLQQGHLFMFSTSCGVFLPIHALQVHIESFLAQRGGTPKTGRLEHIPLPCKTLEGAYIHDSVCGTKEREQEEEGKEGKREKRWRGEEREVMTEE